MHPRDIADSPIEAYLAAVGARLAGPASVRAAILDELRDGLLTAAAAHQSRGLPPQAAARAAIDEFGTPTVVADAFGGELAVAQARRVSLGYLLTGPLVGLSWLVVLAPAGWWRQGVPALAAPVPLLPLVAACIGVGLLVVAATGRPGRWLRCPPHQLLDLTVLLSLTCMAVDLIALAGLAVRTGTQAPWAAVAGLAVTASAARLLCGVAAVQRCRRARVAL
jgi:hypothetical protein